MAWFEKFNITVSDIGFTGVTQITVFIWHTKSGIIVLTVYIDDILLTNSDSSGLLQTKEYLKHYFVTKSWEGLNIF